MIPTPDEFAKSIDWGLLKIAKEAYASLHAAYLEALDREAAFNAAMEDYLDDEIVDALDRPRPCLKVMGVVRGDGSIEMKEAL
jgi:hypothetical protein